jgi:adenylate cyclase
MIEPERRKFEALLRKRGTKLTGNSAMERDILARYQDNCSVLVLDTSGFTRLTQKHGIIHFLALVVAMHDIVKPIIARHHALGYWGEADNIYATFPSARWAVQCALEMQKALASANKRRAPESRLEVCIGIGTGRMLRIGACDCFGDPMNQACKLGEDIAKAGEILITTETEAEIATQAKGLKLIRKQAQLSGVTLDYCEIKSAGKVRWKPAAPKNKPTL